MAARWGAVYQVQSWGADPETCERLDMQAVTQPVAAALAKDFPQIEAISKLKSDWLIAWPVAGG